MSARPQPPLGKELDAILGRFIEDTDDLMTVVDRDARFVYVNPTARRVFGIEPTACIGRTAWEFCHPLDRERTQRAFAEWITSRDESSYTFWNRQVSTRGETRHMHWRIKPHLGQDGQPAFLASIARDISALKETELERLRTETRLTALFAGMLDAVVTIDSRGIVQDASDSVRDLLGYEPSELVGQNVNVLMPEPHRSRHDGYLARYRATGDTWILNTTRQFEALCKNGAPIDIELSVSRIDIPGETEPLFCGSFRDVSARRRAERALVESEHRFRAIFDQEFQYVGLLDPDGTVIEFNRSSLERTGLARADLLGRPLWDAAWWKMDAESRDRLRAAVRDAAGGKFVRFETIITAQQGEQRTLDFSVKPLRDLDEHVAMLITEGRDITDVKRAQEREHAMLRSLAALGESASLLAHEIKNPITAVNLAIRAVADQLGEDHRTVLEELVGRMRRLEQRIRRTLSFTRPVGVEPQAVRAAELFASTADLLRPEIESRRVELTIEVAEGLRPLWVDANLTEEVLTNLVRNALDALTEARDADSVGAQGHIRMTARQVGETAQLTVEDDGPGVPAGIRDDLFRPFFTTKSEGTGLGLAIAKKVVEEQGGSIDLGTSDLGGAAFRLLLPLAVESELSTLRTGA